MNATNYYVSTSRVVLQGDPEAAQTWQDLYRTLPILRNSLSCTVCESLLVEPYTPEDTDCEHHVCKSCKGGSKVMKPACSWCKDYSKYYENVQLRILIQNYKKLCGLIKITRLWNVIQNQGEQGQNIMDIVRESEGGKLKSNLSLAVTRPPPSEEENIIMSPESSVREESSELVEEEIVGDYEVEPPDEIISSPISKLDIFKNNPNIKDVDNIRVKLLEELTETQLSPGVSPPHSTSSSPSPSVVNFANGQKLKSVNRKIKETFILNPFKGKSDLIGPFKRLEPNSKVETSLIRKYSLDGNSEKSILIKQESDNDIGPPPSKSARMSLDSVHSPKLNFLVKEESSVSQNFSVSVVKTEPGEETQIVTPANNFQLDPNKTGDNSKLKPKKSGCRCGNATQFPGKLTCCGQRCPCYVDNLPCIDCKCKGCRNPHMPGGGKMRPALPTLQNMKVLYPPSSQEKSATNLNSKPATNPVIFQPVKSFPDRVVYKSLSAPSGKSDGNIVVQPVKSFTTKVREAGIRMPVSLGKQINIKDLDLSKLPIISMDSVSAANLSTLTIPISSPSSSSPSLPALSKPVTRIVARSNSLQK